MMTFIKLFFRSRRFRLENRAAGFFLLLFCFLPFFAGGRSADPGGPAMSKAEGASYEGAFSESEEAAPAAASKSHSDGQDLQEPLLGKPFFYSASKDGRTLLMLGTVHTMSLNSSSINCYQETVSHITGSAAVFVEDRLAALNLSFHDASRLRKGSKTERERILLGLSPGDKKFAETAAAELERIRAVNKKTLALFYEREGGFEDLSGESQSLLISLGADPKGNYLDFYLQLQGDGLFWEAHSSLSKDSRNNLDRPMDMEAARLAKAHGIRLKILDISPAKIFEDMFEEMKAQARPRNKRLIDRKVIDDLAQEYDQNAARVEETLKVISELYRQGDDSGWLSSTSTPLDNHLLDNRNRIWLQKIKNELESGGSGPVFIAAGLAHFINSGGLLDMLREEGFEIRRMAADCSI